MISCPVAYPLYMLCNVVMSKHVRSFDNLSFTLNLLASMHHSVAYIGSARYFIISNHCCYGLCEMANSLCN